MSYKKVFLKPGKEESLKRFHPWVFSGAIARVEGEPEEGEVVDVYTSKKEFIACGHFQIGSIAVRVLSFRQEPIDHDYWVRRLQVAKDLRCALGLIGNPRNNTYRLVHGEGDNLPGLIIDVYDHTAVMQAHSAGMHLDRMAVADALEEVMGDVIQHIYYKSETTLPFKADLLATENGFLKGGSPENVAMENGLKFHVDWLKGQKTSSSTSVRTVPCSNAMPRAATCSTCSATPAASRSMPCAVGPIWCTPWTAPPRPST